MHKSAVLTESDLLADIIDPEEGDLPADVARFVLRWKFGARAARRMNTLADRNSKGTITDAERQELERYLRVGSFINLVQAKARLSLQRSKRSK
jgi:hypothetical protein